MRIVWGKILPGKWNELEAAFKAAMVVRGDLKVSRTIGWLVIKTIRMPAI